MSWYTKSIIIHLRNIGRSIGINKFISLFFQKKYEKNYRQTLIKFIKRGDIVWDIGANRGYYTRIFSGKVGTKGHVYAFEPDPYNFKKFKSNCSALNNVTLFKFALGDEDGKAFLIRGKDLSGTTSKISISEKKGIPVDIFSGKTLIEKKIAEVPNIIKIDVEGYELEVLKGFGEFIKKPVISVIGVEIHFGILKKNRIPETPREIEILLKNSGFKVLWTDFSHIVGVRYR